MEVINNLDEEKCDRIHKNLISKTNVKRRLILSHSLLKRLWVDHVFSTASQIKSTLKPELWLLKRCFTPLFFPFPHAHAAKLPKEKGQGSIAT